MKKITSILLLLLYTITFYGQWTTDTDENTLVASDTEGGDLQSVGTSDGKTFVVFWKTVPAPVNYELRVQLLDTDGTQLFGTDGMLVSDVVPMSTHTVVWSITIDSDDNLYIGVTGTEDNSAYAFKMNTNGDHLWGDDGVALGTGNTVKILPLADGGAIAAWFPSPQGLMQRIDADGDFVWDSSVTIENDAEPTAPADMFALSDGGFTLVFHTITFGINSELFAQRYNADGDAQWADPVKLSDRGAQFIRQYYGTQDGDVVYYSYSVSSGTRFDSYVQRINPDGTLPWGINGSDFDTNETNYEIDTKVAFSVGSDYVWSICTYTDNTQSLRGEYIQKFDKDTGERQFTDNAKELFALSDQPNVHAGQFQLLNDQPFFLIKSGMDNGASPVTLHATYLDENGDFVWDEETKPIATNEASKSRVQFTKPADGQSVAVFVDEKPSDDFPMIYAQNIVEETMAVSDFENASIFYNNPIGNRLYIKSESAIKTIEVVNILGQKMITKHTNNQLQVNLNTSSWKSGMYIMNITTENGTYKGYKLIK